jgi:predicted esterase
MNTRKGTVIVLIVFCSALFFASVLAGSEEIKIFQADQKIRIDGKLGDWEKVRDIPIVKIPSGKTVEPSPDLTVTAYFSFDPQNFYAAVKVRDDVFQQTSRGWRYGDGFYLTFLYPGKGEESDLFSTFGFSREEHKDVRILVNRDGQYFPGLDIRDVELAVETDEEQHSVIYELALPWELIPPLKPFIHERCRINLIYVDRDHGERRHVLQLHPDWNYDTEMTDLRKGAAVRFETHMPGQPELQSVLSASHFYDDDKKEIIIAVNSPVDVEDWKIRFIHNTEKGTASFYQDLAFQKGKNVIKHTLGDRDRTPGKNVLGLAVIDDKGSLVFRTDHDFFVINREEFAWYKALLARAENSVVFQADETFRASLPTCQIRIEWLEEFMEDAQPYADTNPLALWIEELEFLTKKIEKGEPALFPPGQIARLAHRSGIDGSLQPYSVYIPAFYSGKNPFPLWVTLHGSGVDERKTILYAAKIVASRENLIVLAPRARGLSDWYLGNSGKDVMECIDHIKKMYRIEEKNIILDGFSMGGYGAWRLGILHPGVFRAVIIRSGAIVPPPHLKGENILDLLERINEVDLNIFIIHGDRDNAVPVENARKAAAKLKTRGIPHTYLEVKDAAHGGYDKWDQVFEWLRRGMYL